MANTNFTNFVTQYNKKPTISSSTPVAVNQPQTPAGFYPQKPAGLNPQPQKPVDLAQQAVDLGYVKSTADYYAAEQRGRDSANKIPKTITSNSLKSTSDYELPDYTPPPVSRTQTNAEQPRIIPEAPQPEKPLSLKEQTQKYLQDQLTGGGTIDTAAKREELRIEEKRKLATDLDNQIIATKRRYDKQIEQLEKNPEGVFGGALTSQINKLSREGNRELADLSIAYKIANDDYTGAYQSLQYYIADAKDQRNFELQVFNASLNAINNDLTESEKLALQQQYRLDEIEFENNLKQTQATQESKILEAQAQNYQTLLDAGQITVKDVPEKVLSYLNVQGYATPEQKQAKTQTQSLLDAFDRFRGLGATGAVGAPVSKILPYLGSLIGVGNYNADKSLVENIKSQLTLGNLGFLKGAMSDKDIAFITSASSALNDNMSEKQFKEELVNIQGRITQGILNSPAFSFEEKETALTKQLKLEYPNATPEEILDIVDERLPLSFNTAGNASASSVQIPQSSRLAYVNNNPGNLRYAGQSGATQGEGGFARFSSPEAGYQALQKQIELDKSRGLTVSSFVNKFAPPSENDTNSYIKFVTNQLGISPNTNIAQISTEKLARVIALKESSTNIA